MEQVIKCEACGVAIGTMIPPTLDSVNAQLAGDYSVTATMTRSIIAGLPKEAVQGLGHLLRFRCTAHTIKG